MTAVFRHELCMMFSSLTAYVYGMFSLLAVAIYMMYYNLSIGYANFEYALAGASFALLIMIPIITMRIIAEEKKQKTDQLLYSLPISTAQVVAGKFLAVFVTSAIPLVIVAAYPIILQNYGNLYLPTAFGALFGYIMLTAALLSIGIFISSITESQPMAAGICFAAMILNYYMVTLAEYVATFTFHRNTDEYKTVELEFYQYDGSYCISVLNGEEMNYTDRSSVVDLKEEINSVILDSDPEA